jgi:hypothetical protein
VYDVPGMVDFTNNPERAKVVQAIIAYLATLQRMTFIYLTDATTDPDNISKDLYFHIRRSGVPEDRIVRVLNKVNMMLEPSEILGAARRLESWRNWHLEAEVNYRQLYGAEGVSGPPSLLSVPYLISAVKGAGWDDTENAAALGKEEEAARWETVGAKGEEVLANFIALNPTFLWPKDRLGFTALTQFINSKVSGSVANQLGLQINKLLRAAQRVEEVLQSDEPMEEAQIKRYAADFLTQISIYLQEAAYNKNGQCFNLALQEAGGAFHEGDQSRKERNEEASRVYEVPEAALPEGVVLRQDVAVPGMVDDLSPLNLLIGIHVMDKNFFELVNQCLSRYWELDDATLLMLRTAPIYHGSQDYQPLISRAVEQVYKHVRLPEVISQIVHLQAVSIRRIMRLAIFCLLRSDLPASTLSQFQLISKDATFRDIFDSTLDEFLASKIQHSEGYLHQLASEGFADFVWFASVQQSESALKSLYSDITDRLMDQLNPASHPGAAILGAALSHIKNLAASGSDPHYKDALEWVRQTTLVCYSERASMFVKNLMAHYQKSWRLLFEPNQLIGLFGLIRSRIEKADFESALETINEEYDRHQTQRNRVKQLEPLFKDLRSELPAFLEFIQSSSIFGAWAAGSRSSRASSAAWASSSHPKAAPSAGFVSAATASSSGTTSLTPASTPTAHPEPTPAPSAPVIEAGTGSADDGDDDDDDNDDAEVGQGEPIVDAGPAAQNAAPKAEVVIEATSSQVAPAPESPN